MPLLLMYWSEILPQALRPVYFSSLQNYQSVLILSVVGVDRIKPLLVMLASRSGVLVLVLVAPLKIELPANGLRRK